MIFRYNTISETSTSIFFLYYYPFTHLSICFSTKFFREEKINSLPNWSLNTLTRCLQFVSGTLEIISSWWWLTTGTAYILGAWCLILMCLCADCLHCVTRAVKKIPAQWKQWWTCMFSSLKFSKIKDLIFFLLKDYMLFSSCAFTFCH